MQREAAARKILEDMKDLLRQAEEARMDRIAERLRAAIDEAQRVLQQDGDSNLPDPHMPTR